MINVTAFLEYKSRRRLKSSEKEPKPAAPSTEHHSAASFSPQVSPGRCWQAGTHPRRVTGTREMPPMVF